jgi:O-antigen ligase
LAHTGYFSQQQFAARAPSAVDTLIRSVLCAVVFLAVLISFHPFPTRDQPLEVTDVGDVLNQIGYSSLFLILAGWNLTHQPQRLLLLVRPIAIVTVVWFAFTVVLSWDPSISARRLAYAMVLTGIAGMVLLLPRNPRHFGNIMSAVALIVLFLCYYGVILKPDVGIHQASDWAEPALAGDWRGVFGHKNEASVAMVIFVYVGLFLAGMRRTALGTLIIGLSLLFLYFTHSKTAMAAMVLAYVISVIMVHTRQPLLAIGLALLVLVLLNVASVGSIYFDGIRELIGFVADPSFTGRADVWKFAMGAVAQRPLTGYGFSAFWGTEQVVYGMAGASWANTASHAHNGFLDLALTVGIPGSVLVTLWLFVLPLVDYFRSPTEPQSAPLKLFFLRVCLYAAYESCFETMFTEVGAFWLVLFFAAFGLCLLARTRVSA